MMPALVEAPPAGDAWIHEIKYDGYRTQLALEGDRRRAFTRRGHDWSHIYRSVLDEAQALACRSALIEGEMIVQDRDGRSDFDALRRAIGARGGDFVFMAFDLLHLDGADLRSIPLAGRRERLRAISHGVGPACPIQFSDEVADGEALFEAADAMDLEGIVSKRRSSRYRSGYSKSWLKTKTFTRSELAVVGVERGIVRQWRSSRGSTETA